SRPSNSPSPGSPAPASLMNTASGGNLASSACPPSSTRGCADPKPSSPGCPCPPEWECINTKLSSRKFRERKETLVTALTPSVLIVGRRRSLAYKFPTIGEGNLADAHVRAAVARRETHHGNFFAGLQRILAPAAPAQHAR